MKEKRKELSLPLMVTLSIVVVVVIGVGGYTGYRWHETPQFCSVCHLMQPYVDSLAGKKVSENDGSPLLANLHAKSGLVCLDCHKTTIQQQTQELITYIKGDYPTPLEKRKFPQTMCLACHPHDSREALIALTANYQVNYDGVTGQFKELLAAAGYDLNQHKTINPHAMTLDPNNTSNPHASGGPLIECSSCHSMHDESAKLDYCFGCHHSQTFAPCATCHGKSDANMPSATSPTIP
jgi:hypothetical protein